MDLTVFEYQMNPIRTITKDGDPWWVAKDVCDVLGLDDVRRAVEKLDDDERCLTPLVDQLGRKNQMWIISEPGLYGLILTSRKPEAKQFKRWVKHEVLPSIRKNGRYSLEGYQNSNGLRLILSN